MGLFILLVIHVAEIIRNSTKLNVYITSTNFSTIKIYEHYNITIAVEALGIYKYLN